MCFIYLKNSHYGKYKIVNSSIYSDTVCHITFDKNKTSLRLLHFDMLLVKSAVWSAD